MTRPRKRPAKRPRRTVRGAPRRRPVVRVRIPTLAESNPMYSLFGGHGPLPILSFKDDRNPKRWHAWLAFKHAPVLDADDPSVAELFPLGQFVPRVAERRRP